MPVSTSLLGELRRRILDVRFSRRQLGLAVSDPQVTSAIAEVTMGHLLVSVAGGSAPSLDFDLTNPRYDTIGRLYQVLSRAEGYTATLDEDANTEHLAIDIEPFPPLNVQSTGVTLSTHLFSDQELEEILREAVQRHNPSFTVTTLPPQESAFVLTLAQAGVTRRQAQDSSKRKGLDKDVASLIALADSFERIYDKDTKKHMRAIQSPREANPNTVEEGDVMLGKMFRRSLRTGFMSPLSQTIPPDATVLLDPDEHDVEDDNVRVNWQRNKNMEFYSYELWMDTRPDVVRTREGGLIFAGTPVSALSLEDGMRNASQRMTTSTMVFRSFGSNSNSSRSSFSTFVEEFGQLIRSFSVGNLESQSTYYFRLYIININYIAASSNIVRATTKPLRSRFMPQFVDPNTPFGPSGPFSDRISGPAGATVNFFLDTTKGAFTTNHTLVFGQKNVVPTILFGGYQLQMTVPVFQNIGIKDVALISPTGLVDTRAQAFTVSAT